MHVGFRLEGAGQMLRGKKAHTTVDDHTRIMGGAVYGRMGQERGDHKNPAFLHGEMPSSPQQSQPSPPADRKSPSDDGSAHPNDKTARPACNGVHEKICFSPLSSYNHAWLYSLSDCVLY